MKRILQRLYKQLWTWSDSVFFNYLLISPQCARKRKKPVISTLQKLLDSGFESTFHCDPLDIVRGLWQSKVINGVWVLVSLRIGLEGLIPYPCGYFLRDSIVGKDIILESWKNIFIVSLTWYKDYNGRNSQVEDSGIIPFNQIIPSTKIINQKKNIYIYIPHIWRNCSS